MFLTRPAYWFSLVTAEPICGAGGVYRQLPVPRCPQLRNDNVFLNTSSAPRRADARWVQNDIVVEVQTRYAPPTCPSDLYQRTPPRGRKACRREAGVGGTGLAYGQKGDLPMTPVPLDPLTLSSGFSEPATGKHFITVRGAWLKYLSAYL